jgi:hypothetical protein
VQPCPDPPTKEYLLSEVQKLATELGIETGINEKRVPDKDWLLVVLSTLKYDHEIFRKEYLPPLKPPPP